MNMRRAVFAALLAGALGWLGMASGAQAEAVPCRDINFEDTPFTICEVNAGSDLFMALNGPDGMPLRSFAALQDTLSDARLVFAMNGGMFHKDGRPVGLYVENGKELSAASDGGGYGNFGMLPNGIFCIGPELRVWESSAYAQARPQCQFATQSGPMLVINGALHPRFRAESTSRYRRNGVATSADGSRAVFAISGVPVTFHQFARLFRDYLALPDALFLDANVSRLYAPNLGRNDRGAAMGPIIGLAEPFSPVE